MPLWPWSQSHSTCQLESSSTKAALLVQDSWVKGGVHALEHQRSPYAKGITIYPISAALWWIRDDGDVRKGQVWCGQGSCQEGNITSCAWYGLGGVDIASERPVRPKLQLSRWERMISWRSLAVLSPNFSHSSQLPGVLQRDIFFTICIDFLSVSKSLWWESVFPTALCLPHKGLFLSILDII